MASVETVPSGLSTPRRPTPTRPEGNEGAGPSRSKRTGADPPPPGRRRRREEGSRENEGRPPHPLPPPPDPPPNPGDGDEWGHQPIFPPRRLRALLTLSSESFSTFPRGTCPLSVPRHVFSLGWDLPPVLRLRSQTARLGSEDERRRNPLAGRGDLARGFHPPWPASRPRSSGLEAPVEELRRCRPRPSTTIRWRQKPPRFRVRAGSRFARSY